MRAAISLSRFGASAVMEACTSHLSVRRIFHIPKGLLAPAPWPHSIASKITDLVKPIAPLRPDRVCDCTTNIGVLKFIGYWNVYSFATDGPALATALVASIA